MIGGRRKISATQRDKDGNVIHKLGHKPLTYRSRGMELSEADFVDDEGGILKGRKKRLND